MSIWVALLIFTLIVIFWGLSFFLYTYPRLKKELQEEINRDVRNNLDEINYIKFRIHTSMARLISAAALLITFIVLSIIYGAF
jgi:hypothetical protein